MIRKTIAVCALILGSLPVFSQTRSFRDLFPSLKPPEHAQVFSSQGLVVSAKTKTLRFLPLGIREIDLSRFVLAQNPSFLAESLLVIPTAQSIGFIQIYNALSNIRGLKGRLYHSATRDEDIPLFEEATRIVSESKNSSLPDPPYAPRVPDTETIYLRLKDVNFGNSYYRADMSASPRGLVYRLSNVKSLSYLFIPVIKEGKFTVQLYFEPIAEGILVYSIAGMDVSDFIASRTHIPSAIQKRLEVIIQWVVEGITR